MCTACLVSSGSTSSNLLGDEEIIMRALAEGEFVQQAKPAYDRVFGTENPFESSFAPTIEARMILFPVHYMMERPLARAIEKASSLLNETSFYLSLLERPKAEPQHRPYHWQIPFTHLEEYRALGYPFVLENAIYSSCGTWGVMFSHERHGLLGGSRQFVESIVHALPDLRQQVEDFLAVWKQNQTRFGSNLDWLPRMLEHVYGEGHAQELMVRAGLSFSAD